MPETSIGGEQEQFPETIGSLLQVARDPKAVQHRAALNRLFLQYWRPVYAVIRRRGHSIEDAKDLTQDFMVQLLERGLLSRYDPERGRFRAYLKGAVDLFLREQARARGRKKRSAEWAIHPVSIQELENAQFAADLKAYGPEELFDINLAEQVLSRGLRTLERELDAEGRREYFDVYRAYELAEGGQPTYADVARALNLTEAAVRKHLEYVRRRLEDVIRRTSCEYATSPEEAKDELERHKTAWRLKNKRVVT